MNIQPGDDPWKAIEARDRLNMICLQSYLANLLYPDEPDGQSRTDRLETDHPAFSSAMRTACRKWQKTYDCT